MRYIIKIYENNIFRQPNHLANMRILKKDFIEGEASLYF